MADIKATLILDSKPFSDGLKEALAEAQAWRRKMEGVLNFNPLERMREAMQAVNEAVGKATDTKPVEDFSKAVDDVAQKMAAADQAAQTFDNISDSTEAASKSSEDFAKWVDEVRARIAAMNEQAAAAAAAADDLGQEQEKAGQAARKAAADQEELEDVIRVLGLRMRGTRDEYAAMESTGQQFEERTKTTAASLRGLKENFELTEEQIQKVDRALAYGERGLASYHGKASRLGLAATVQIGIQNSLANSLRGMGPAGAVAAGGLGLVSGALAGLNQPLTAANFRLTNLLNIARRIPAILGLATAAALALGGVALTRAANASAKLAQEIDVATYRTGLSVEAFQEYTYAAQQAGVETSLLTTTLQRLQRRAADAHQGNAGLAAAFAELGVSLTDSNGRLLGTEQLLDQVADGLAGVTNNADKLRLAFRIFDTEGAKFLPLLSLGSEGMRELRNEARELGLVISGDAVMSLRQYQQTVQQLGKQFEAARTEIAAAFLPILQNMLLPLLQLQVVPLLQQAADRVRDFTTRFLEAGEAGKEFRARIIGLVSPVLRIGDAIIGIGKGIGSFVTFVLAHFQALGAAIGTLSVQFEDWFRRMRSMTSALAALARGDFARAAREFRALDFSNPFDPAAVRASAEDAARELLAFSDRMGDEAGAHLARAFLNRYEGLADGLAAATAKAAARGLTPLVDGADDGSAALARLQEQAERTAKTFEDRLMGIEIGMLDGESRELAQLAVQFRDMRDAIAEAAVENAEFAAKAEGLIARSFELEQRRILEIQESYARKRQEEAEKQGQELAAAIADRERAIVDTQTRGRLNQAQALALEHQRRMQDAEAMYAGLIQKAAEYGHDTTRLEQLRVTELLAIQQGYERDVQAIYDDLYAQIEDRQHDLVRAAAEARGDDMAVFGLDFDAATRRIDAYYKRVREEAKGNAELLAVFDEQELAERLHARETYWRDVTQLTTERGKTLAELEADLARQRAELDGDAAGLAQLRAAEEIRTIQQKYDELEQRFAHHAGALAEIAEARNEELALANERMARNMQGIADEAFAESLSPAIDALISDLNSASRETLKSIRTQLGGWRQAYGSNGEVVKLIDAALSNVGGRLRQVNEETRKHIEDLLTSARRLSGALAGEDTRRGLSTLETDLLNASERMQELKDLQAEMAAALPTAFGEQRTRLVTEIAQLDEDMRAIYRNSVADAEKMARDAMKAYQDGLEAAQRDISASAAQLLQADVDRVLRRISDVQTNALNEARTNLVRQIANLQAVGFDQASLAPLREQLAQLDAVLARSARSMAEFASAQHQNLREVAQAVLSTDQAEKVANQTYMETIRLRRAAVIEAREQGAAVEEVAQVTQALTQAQLQYIASLQGQVSRLQALKGEYSGIYGTVSDLADLLGRAIPPEVLEAQEKLALSLLDGVKAAQEAGQTFDQYSASLDAATSAWQDYESASRQALQQELADLEAITRTGVIPVSRMQETAQRIAEQFEIPVREAFDRIRAFTKGELEDPFGDVEFQRPDILSDIFENLNVEAAKTPEVLSQIDDEIGRLEAKVESLKQLIAFDLDFESVGQQLVSGYSDVIDQMGAITEETFTEAAGQAVEAFTKRLADERSRLQEELESQLGSAAEAAGLTAGEGMMTAFARGIDANRDAVKNAVERALADIRAMLPSSDAKVGPLSDLTASGRTFFKTWMGGVQDGHARALRSMDQMLGKLSPSASLLMAGGGAGAAGGVGSAPINVNVDGRTVNPAPGPLAADARTLARTAAREVAVQLTMRGRRRR